MFRKLNIQNFKTLAAFAIELGSANVIIGANGSGKTNILEAIAMGSASAGGKLDSDSLSQRIRVTRPEFMRSAFDGATQKEIIIEIECDDPYDNYDFELIVGGRDRRLWRNHSETSSYLVKEYDHRCTHGWHPHYEGNYFPRELDLPAFGRPRPLEVAEPRLVYSQQRQKSWTYTERFAQFGVFANYVIYSPEAFYLRNFEAGGDVSTLGMRGEGLFQALRAIFTDKAKKAQQEEIREHLALFDWFQKIDIPKTMGETDFRISFKDRFLDSKHASFDQQSANEGLLRLLFYLVLFTSDTTPRFFAIENIDTALNPRMCWELMGLLVQLAKRHGKQFIVTTHNASTLNGLDLKDDEQRLFVASRNGKGHTRVQRIDQKPQSGGLLSEIWTKGYIGGMPDNL